MKAALLILVAGCVGSYQSARPLAPQKMQVTADVNAMYWGGAPSARPPETRGWMNGGDILVRAGIIDRLDGGLRFGRSYESESKGDQYSHLFLDAKRQLTPNDSLITVSVALPVGLVWSERRDVYSDHTLALAPSVLVGYDVAPTRELVAGASVLWLDPIGNDAFVRSNATSSYFGWRLSVGLRMSSPSHTWAVQPELSLLTVHDPGQMDGGFMLSIGLGVTAGN